MGRPENKNGEATQITSSGEIMSEEKEAITERAEYVYEQVNHWIENADNKVSVSCGIFSGVFGVVTFLSEQYIKIPENSSIQECWKTIHNTCFFISLFLMILALACYASAIIPNLKSSGKPHIKKKYPIYYGDIASLDECEYKRLMRKGTEKTYRNELQVETWFNSGICLRKMKRYKAGVILSIVAIIAAILSFAARYMMYQ